MKKIKYWYATDVYCCVLCGKETKQELNTIKDIDPWLVNKQNNYEK
jgi:hypothetical protein